MDVLLELLLFCKYIGKQCIICRDSDCSRSPPASALIGVASRQDGIHINTILPFLFIEPTIYLVIDYKVIYLKEEGGLLLCIV
jgi:hypothetical protein